MQRIKSIVNNNKIQLVIVISFFILYFIMGIFFVGDYGISTDEPQERKTMYVNLNYILTQFGRESMDVPDLESYKDKYYGMALQMPMTIFEVMDLEVPIIFIFRHFYTFSICFLGYIFFFLLTKKLFNNNFLALLGTFMLMFYPRFLAEQFYNLKDMVFTSVFIISMWATIQLIESNFSRRWILVFTLIVTLTTNVRIVGIIFLLLVLGYIWLVLILQKIYKQINIHKNLTWQKVIEITTIMSIVFFIVFIISIPGVWENPIKGVIDVFTRFSDYPGGGNVVFMGKVIENTEIPWYYIPVWLMISLPLWYILLFLISAIIYVRRIVELSTNGKINELFGENRYIIWTVMLFFGPWLGMVIKRANLYNGWRHCYFMLPPMILLCIYGVRYLYQISKIKYFMVIIILFGIISQLSWEVRYHPYEMVYFNPIGRLYAKDFDRDYWHLSELHAWKYIYGIEEEEIITVNTSGYQFFQNILPKEEKKRIKIEQNPTYYIETYRGVVGNHIEKEGYEEIYSIVVDNFKVATVFKKIIGRVNLR